MTSQVRRGVFGGISYGWGLGIVNAGAVQLGLRLDVAPALVAGHLTAFSLGLFLVGSSDLLLVRSARVASPTLLGLSGFGLLVAPSVLVSLTAALAVGATSSVVLSQSQRLVTASRPDDRWLLWTNVGTALAVAASSWLVAVVGIPLLVALPGLLAGWGATTATLPGEDAAPGDGGSAPHDMPSGQQAGPGGPEVPEEPATSASRAADLPARTRPVDPRLLVLVVLAVGTELTLANRVPDHLARSGLDGVAALAPALVYVGVAASRAWLAMRPPRPLPAVAGSAGIVLVAVAGLLLLRSPGLGVVAVLTGGVGAGALFPLVAAATLASATDPSRTSARITAMVGLGTGVTPLAVGFADGVTGGAFWLVLPMATAVAVVARRLASSP